MALSSSLSFRPVMSFLLFSLLSIFAQVSAQQGPTAWTASPFNPPSLPLAVKSPYLNAWAPLGNNSAAVNNAWPRTQGTEMSILGWYAAVRVDGTSYRVLGDFNVNNASIATQKTFSFSPTQSSYLLDCGGKVTVNITFVTPFQATDLNRLSMPFSYLQIVVEPEDSNTHDVQVYADVSGEWISGDDSAISNWTISESNDFVYLQMQLANPQAFTENLNRAQDSILYHAIKKTSSTSWMIANADDTRAMFANGTALTKTADGTFHAVGNPFDVLSLSQDLGVISSQSDPVIFAIGVVRDPVIKFVNQNIQDEDRSAYYWSSFSNIHDVIQDVLNNYDSALSDANSLDSQLASAASSSQHYGLLSLALRQAMSAIEYTIVKEDSGKFNTSDVKAFMKDNGGVGSGGVNAVDVIYAAMPIYLYLNPAILGYLLSPLLTYQESVQYQNNFAAEDLGGPFPNATGNFASHDTKIEQSANMLIMALAHAQTSGDGSLLSQHYNLLNQWGSYLANNTLSPGNDAASASDAISLVNQTNVVVKGIVGLGAMAKIADAVGQSSDASQYSSLASSYASQLLSDASSSSSFSVAFGSSSPGFLYNLYADKLLGLDIIDSSVYSGQTSYYSSATSTNKYGIVLDSTNTSSVARADWMLFSASIATDSGVSNNMINQVYNYVSANLQNKPFPILYNPSSGSQISGGAGPGVGAMFAPLALKVGKKSISTTGVGGSTSKKSSTGAIVGGVVGGVVGAVLLGGLAFFLWRRRERTTGRYNKGYEDPDRIQPIRVKPVNLPSDPALDSLSETNYTGMHELRASPFQFGAVPTGGSAGPGSVAGSTSDLPNPYPTTIVSASGASSSGVGGVNALYRGPMVINNLGDNEADRNDVAYAAILAAQSNMANSSAGTSNPKAAMRQDELRNEVDDLRREIERMKEERQTLGEAPPSYEEELRYANALAKQNYQ